MSSFSRILFKRNLLVAICWFLFSGAFAQDQKEADRLARIYQQNSLTDTAKMRLLGNLSFNEVRDYRVALKYAEELIELAQGAGNKNYLSAGYFLKGTKERLLGNLDEAFAAFIKSAEVAQKAKLFKSEANAYSAIADIYSVADNHSNAKDYYNKAITALRQSNDSVYLASTLVNAGDEFRKISSYDSAISYFKEAQLIFIKRHHTSGEAYSLGGLGMIYSKIGQNDIAKKDLSQAIKTLEGLEDYYPVCDYLLSMADVHLKEGDNKAALSAALRSLHFAEQLGLKEQMRDASLKLSELYERTGNSNAAFTYYKKYIVNRDSLSNIATERKTAELQRNFERSQSEIKMNALQIETRTGKKLNISLGVILGLTIILLGILFRNNQSKQKAYKILNLQKQETDRQRAKAEAALSELQQTQRQLIQTAKMASLGELTAGIAHEIQNPLNFVNNFSEVSVEMLNELREGTANKLTATDKAEADQLINDLADNLKKISDHGKRADAIVKGMLHHSRVSTGKKEPVDINALADEYLRLSYHGLRAKDKSFNANFTENFDESIGKIEAIGQDIGRVLLNLYNNAFYAVNEKKQRGNVSFEPLVAVTTKKAGNNVEISVKDNGTGIPQKLHDKIFQPFFTTKPTGQGTGLGLSLSYDIIKAHGGDLKVETEEGVFTNFIIRLPLGNSNGALA